VLGDGKLGLLAAQVLALAGVRVCAVGHHADKLAILARRGIETVLAADFSPRPVDLVIEATGTAAGFATALAVTRPCGTLVLKSRAKVSPRRRSKETPRTAGTAWVPLPKLTSRSLTDKTISAPAWGEDKEG
jgi:threonine dehydrogenase-like Zn-dependent dehydrogenase